jgi:hypothetical protein
MEALTHETPSQSWAEEHFRHAVDSALEGGPVYPRGAVFVPADDLGAVRVALGYAREGRPLVLVFPDGEERVLQPRPSPLLFDLWLPMLQTVGWGLERIRALARRTRQLARY